MFINETKCNCIVSLKIIMPVSRKLHTGHGYIVLKFLKKIII